MAKRVRIEELERKIELAPLTRQEIERSIRCKVLVVCEGSKTEPNYFKSFSMMRNSSSLVFEVLSDGGGINTLAVVGEAIKLREKAEKKGIPYDSVWVVFDKDGFPDADFDNAILKAKQNNVNCAWSNEAFELWYVYHFDNRSTAMTRTEYANIITDRVRSRLGDNSYKYQKNDKLMRNTLSRCGCDEDLAIRWAEKQASEFQNTRYHLHNPATTVFKLVRLLIGKDKDFNNMIKKSIEEA